MRIKLIDAMYETHLQAALELGSTRSWNLIQQSILHTVDQEFEKKYKLLDNKIPRLAKTQKQEYQHLLT